MIKELLAAGKSEAEVKEILITHIRMNALEAQMAIDLELGRAPGGDNLRVRKNGSIGAARSLVLLPDDEPGGPAGPTAGR